MDSYPLRTGPRVRYRNKKPTYPAASAPMVTTTKRMASQASPWRFLGSAEISADVFLILSVLIRLGGVSILGGWTGAEAASTLLH